MRILKGTPTLGRIATGTTFVYSRPTVTIPKYAVEGGGASLSAALSRLGSALERTKADLLGMKSTLQDAAPAAVSGYVDAAIPALEYTTVIERVKSRLGAQRLNVEWIYSEVMKEIAETPGKSSSDYLKERAPDVAALTHRVIGRPLSAKSGALPETMETSKVNFLSVGTNDLIQCTLAIDRGDESVAGDYELLHPSILRCLKLVADCAKAKGLEASVCGEIAGRALAHSSKGELTRYIRGYMADGFGRLRKLFSDPRAQKGENRA